MLTFEEKAGAWDGLKDAMIDMGNSPAVTPECNQMAKEFLQIMRQLEDTIEKRRKNTVE